MRILVVDDEELIRAVIKEYLILNNYEVDEASNGEEAVDMSLNNKYDLIIMDIMMPKKDGFQAYKEIKDIKNIPVIMLSAKNEENDKLAGFDLGIDDYVTKPFSPKELIARVKAVTKRFHLDSKIVIDTLVIDNLAHTVCIDEIDIFLTPKEYDLLLYFISNKNIALSREKLLSNIWGYDYCGDYRTVDTHVKMLRKHLEKYGQYIITVRGVGYKFEYKV